MDGTWSDNEENDNNNEDDEGAEFAQDVED